MRGSVQLPEFADLGTLPTTHRGMRAFGGGGMRAVIRHRPAPHLGPVELEGVQSQDFGRREAVGARRLATKTLVKEVNDWLGPGGGVVTAGGSRGPPAHFLLGASVEVFGGQRVEAAARQVELLGRFDGRYGLLPEAGQHMTDESWRVTIG